MVLRVLIADMERCLELIHVQVCVYTVQKTLYNSSDQIPKSNDPCIKYIHRQF